MGCRQLDSVSGLIVSRPIPNQEARVRREINEGGRGETKTKPRAETQHHAGGFCGKVPALGTFPQTSTLPGAEPLTVCQPESRTVARLIVCARAQRRRISGIGLFEFALPLEVPSLIPLAIFAPSAVPR